MICWAFSTKDFCLLEKTNDGLRFCVSVLFLCTFLDNKSKLLRVGIANRKEDSIHQISNKCLLKFYNNIPRRNISSIQSKSDAKITSVGQVSFCAVFLWLSNHCSRACKTKLTYNWLLCCLYPANSVVFQSKKSIASSNISQSNLDCHSE